jgi:hypothetical protein
MVRREEEEMYIRGYRRLRGQEEMQVEPDAGL